MRIRIIAVLATMVAALIPVSAGAVALMFGPDGPQSAQDRVGVLYASRADGSTIAVAKVGDETMDGGQIIELGVPSETADGRVLFGAQILDRGGRSDWDILVADPNAPVTERISHAIMPLALSTGCTPAFKVDPYPVGTPNGAVAFMAPRREGGTALFFYRGGHVDCLIRSGDTLADGREVSGMAFGTAEAASGDAIVLKALLKPKANDSAQPAIWWHNHLEAVLLASPGHAVQEIAVEGARNPQGRTFGALGLPSAGVGPSGETEIAFADRSATVNSLYVYRDGKLGRVLGSGSQSGAGQIGFLSQGRPSLGPAGTVAVRAGVGNRELILVTSRHGTHVIARAGDALTPDSRLENFGDPWIVNAGRIYFPAYGGSFDGFLERDATGNVRELGSSGIREASFTDEDEARPFVASGTLFANQRGNFTFLGGR